MSRRIRRIITRVIVFLLLIVGGAIVNVAVAWGCAVFVSPKGSHVNTSKGWHAPVPPVVQQGKELDYQIRRVDAFGTTRLRANMGWSDRNGGEGPAFASIAPYWTRFPEPLHDRSPTGMNMSAYGWPYRSLLFRWYMTRSIVADQTISTSHMTFVRGIELPDFSHSPAVGRFEYLRGLPLEPIWPGFAINTLFYAAILWLLFAAPFALRRRRRIKRGLCVKCGYDLRGSEASVCPECGTQAQRAANTPTSGAG